MQRRPARRFGTPAHRASVPTGQPQRPVAPRRYTQDELRARRRAGFMAGYYGGDWSLAAEVAAVVAPLADRIAAADRPERFRHSPVCVPLLAEAVHELVGVVIGWVAQRDARARTSHLKDDPGRRQAAMTLICDLAKRPELPEVTVDMLADGSWSAALIAMADSVDVELADLLARAYPPNAAGLRGQVSRSERLHELLRRTLDRAAVAMEQRLDRDEHNRPASADHRTPDERARAELAALGVKTD
ncbi:hypothetical protein [Mycobacterium paraintracellulare]|uniref:hypothetical protein n=1 Tax=Mycobacterium paraintracellulare TaxID=1138383 RepID=UPI001F2F89F3|nr:hypothetical protein [Mycobacterium paraintracellulare]